MSTWRVQFLRTLQSKMGPYPSDLITVWNFVAIPIFLVHYHHGVGTLKNKRQREWQEQRTRTVTRTCRLSFKILATMTTMWNKTNRRFEFPSFVKWIFYYSTIFDTLTVFSYIIIIWLSSVKWHLRALRTIIFTTNFWNENNRDWLLQPAHAVMHPWATTNIIWSQ